VGETRRGMRGSGKWEGEGRPTYDTLEGGALTP
jgi:hypothetical protein